MRRAPRRGTPPLRHFKQVLEVRGASLQLGFAGTPEFAVPALDVLISRNWSVKAVFTQPDRPAGRGRAVRQSAVKRRALELGLEVHQPVSGKTPQMLQLLENLRLDALIVVAYGLILPPPVLASPRLGCFNIHASLLPRWRGAAPIQRALLAGDARTGVTIMRMTEGLDAGPILAERPLEIGVQDTAGSLHDKLSALGAALMGQVIAELAEGGAAEIPQSDTGITHASKIDKAEALIDWRKDAEGILRRVRAFNPWPVAETRLEGTQLRIWEALVPERRSPRSAPGTVEAAADAGIDVACGAGILRITRLQLAGRRPLSAQEFLRARRLDGACFTSP